MKSVAKANKYNPLSIRQLKQTAIEFEAEAIKTEMLNGTYQVILDSKLVKCEPSNVSLRAF